MNTIDAPISESHASIYWIQKIGSQNSLEVDEDDINEGGKSTLCQVLKLSNTVVELIICDNCNWGGTGSVAVAEALCVNRNISELEIGANNAIGSAGCSAIADAMRVSQLQMLHIWENNGVGQIGASLLAYALKYSATMHVLGVWDNNNVGSVGAVALFKALEINKSVLEFTLGGNNAIGSMGMFAAADMLRVNGTLTELNIGCENNLGTDGFAAVCDALQNNITLSSLTIGGRNAIGELIGINACCLCLRRNKALRSLSLGAENGINIDGIKLISSAFQENKILEELKIFGLVTECEFELAKAIFRNPVLKAFVGFDLKPFSPHHFDLSEYSPTCGSNRDILADIRRRRDERWNCRKVGLWLVYTDAQAAFPRGTVNLMFALPSEVSKLAISYL
jgi:hypothetical protein